MIRQNSVSQYGERLLLFAVVLLLVSFLLGIILPVLALGGCLAAGFAFVIYKAGSRTETKLTGAVRSALAMILMLVPITLVAWVVSIAASGPASGDVDFFQALSNFGARDTLLRNLGLFGLAAVGMASLGGAIGTHLHLRKLMNEYIDVEKLDEPGWVRVSIFAFAAAGLLVVMLQARIYPDSAWSTFVTRFMGLFVEAAPFLLLGALISGVIGAFVLPSDIARFSPKNPLAGAFAGSMLGFVFPVCECGVVPVVRRLFAKGLPLSTGVAFLLGAPVLNVIVLLSTSTAFGWGTVLLARFALTAVVAIVVGLLFALPGARKRSLREESVVLAPSGGQTNVSAEPRISFTPGIHKSFVLATSDIYSMGRLLVLGALVAAAMQTLADREALIALGSGPVTSVWVMQALAFLLSVCSTVDAFLALALAGTFTTGSIIAFLTFGPMVDIKSTAMFLAVFRARAVAYMILIPLLMTMLFSVWFNLNVGG